MTKYTGVYLNQDQGDKWTAAEHDGTKWVSETKSADGDHATLGTTTDAAETDHTASGTVMKFLKGVLQTLKGILTTKIDQTTDGTTNRVVAKISQTAGENVVTLGGSLTSPNNTLKVRDSYAAKEAKRVKLTPGSESTQTFAAAFEVLQVLNYGPGDVYLDIDSAAAIGGADDVLIEEGTSIPIPMVGTDVHLIGSSASVVQLVGYRTPAS